MSTSAYSPELVAELATLPAPVSFDDAVAFAEEHGLKPRSVIAKLKSMGIEYAPKPVRVTKRGEPVVAKAEFVAAIEKAIGAALPSLVKASKPDLETIAAALAAKA
jgi:hypothetical protein